jgi:hypothetical protein
MQENSGAICLFFADFCQIRPVFGRLKGCIITISGFLEVVLQLCIYRNNVTRQMCFFIDFSTSPPCFLRKQKRGLRSK